MENDAKRKSIEDEEVDDDVVSDEKNSSAPQFEDSGIDDDVFYDSDGNEQDEEWVLGFVNTLTMDSFQYQSKA